MPHIENNLKQKLEQGEKLSVADMNELIRIIDSNIWHEANENISYRKKNFRWDYKELLPDINPDDDEFEELPGIRFFDDCVLVHHYEDNFRVEKSSVYNRESKTWFETEGLIFWFDSKDEIELFVEGVALLKKDDRIGLINSTGEIVVDPDYEFISTSICHYSLDKYILWYKKTENNCGFIFLDGTPAHEITYEEIKPHFSDNFSREEFFFAVKQNNKWGLIEGKGLKISLFCDHEEIRCFYDHFHIHTELFFVIVKNNHEKYGVFIPLEGWLVEPQWDAWHLNAERFVISFKKENQSGILNLHKKTVYTTDLQIKIDELTWLGEMAKYFVVSHEVTGKYAVTDNKLHLLTDFIFEHPPGYHESTGEFVFYYQKGSNYVYDRIEYPASTFFRLYGIGKDKESTKAEPREFNKRYKNQLPELDKEHFATVLITSLAGGGFYENEWEVVPEIGDELILRHELSNDYDSNAILVLLAISREHNQKLGYIPRKVNKQLIGRFREGEKLAARIIDPGHSWLPPLYYIEVYKEI